jgi:ubiquinone/menaquinone biosynthesis C-methylase UbiE
MDDFESMPNSYCSEGNMTDEAGISAHFNRHAENYERVYVPAVMGAWAADLLEMAALRPGERVLDVACGTGIVARIAAPQVGAAGRVVGLDFNDGMLAVARVQPAPTGASIEWRQGDATALPFPDAAFDAVLCQQGLQFIPDRVAALRAMRRVLARPGRLVISVYCRSEPLETLVQQVSERVGSEATATARTIVALADRRELAGLVTAAGFQGVRIETRAMAAQFASVHAAIAYYLSGILSSAISGLDEASRAALVADLSTALEPYIGNDGVTFPTEAHVVVATP